MVQPDVTLWLRFDDTEEEVVVGLGARQSSLLRFIMLVSSMTLGKPVGCRVCLPHTAPLTGEGGAVVAQRPGERRGWRSWLSLHVQLLLLPCILINLLLRTRFQCFEVILFNYIPVGATALE